MLERSLPYATRMASRSLTIPSNGRLLVTEVFCGALLCSAGSVYYNHYRTVCNRSSTGFNTSTREIVASAPRAATHKIYHKHAPTPNPRGGTRDKWHSCKGKLQTQYNNK